MRINLYTQQSITQLAASKAAQSTTVISTVLQPGRQPKDATVTLSIDAVTQSQAASLYGAFFTGREGFNTDALALGAVLPQATSSSTGLSDDQVSQDARTRMDAVYAAMATTSNPFSNTDQDYNSLFGSLDRRSLLAVAQNEGGLFSDQEQASAYSLMGQQQALATGQVTGPQADALGLKRVEDYNQILTLTASFLDNVSDAEKATSEWKLARARSAGVSPTTTKDSTDDALAKLMISMGLR